MRLIPLHLIPSGTKIDFLGKRWFAFIFSIVTTLGTLGLIGTKGFNFGIDFTGGIVMELRFTEENPDIAALRDLLSENIEGEISLQYFGSEKDVLLRIQEKEEIGQDGTASATVLKVKELLAKEVSPSIDYRKVDYVGPQVSEELLRSGALAMVLSFLGIMLYVWFRFEWQFGVGAIIALLHDAILTVGFYSLMGIEFNLASVAAVLTVVGYSINDSVVIYDRIRENLRKYKKKPIDQLLNESINETLSRTILTVSTTVFAVIALILVGGPVIQGFSLALLFGIVVGTYSSIYVSAPILIYLNIRKVDVTQPGKEAHV
ncbi:MAG: secF [Rickettsiales bacterium]|jgi:preprotein translocase SecF subunit|nr:secF [Rickettsiales bacterium]